MNCHIYGKQSGNLSLFHLRGKNGGTILNRNGVLRKLSLKNDQMVSGAVYGDFHPSGRYGVFSSCLLYTSFMLYRYAEVLLTYVECLVESGDWQNPDVEKYINMIRNRAGMPNMDKTVYNSQEKVRELYLSLIHISTERLGAKIKHSIRNSHGSRSINRPSPKRKHSDCLFGHVMQQWSPLLYLPV